MGVYMVKQTTQVVLAVSGHKYPDGEHTPGKNTKPSVNYPEIKSSLPE